MLDKNIEIRPAIVGDSSVLLEWRNDPVTRENSLTTDLVSEEDHEKWFASSLQRKDRVIFMGCIYLNPGMETPCGMCRFDISEDGTSAVISINLSPDFRGRGLSLPILIHSISKFFQHCQSVSRLNAEIRESNLASVNLFTQAGFVRRSVESGVGQYSLDVR